MTSQKEAPAGGGSPNGRGWDARGGAPAHSSNSTNSLGAQRLSITGDAAERLAETLGFAKNRSLSNRKRFRSGAKGAFMLDPGRGTWADFAAGIKGGPIDLVIHAGAAHDKAEAFSWLAKHGFAERAPQTDRQNSERRQAQREKLDRSTRVAAAQKLWRAVEPIRPAGLVARYLVARACPPPWPPSLRGGRIWCAEAGDFLPALVAAVTPIDAPDAVHGVHRTWLAEPGRKAWLDKPKAALGAVGGGAVVLGEITTEAAIAEGIESALSAGRALKLPAIATLGAGFMARACLPRSVRRVIVAPDRDAGGTGEKAARTLAARLVAEGRSVAIAWPPGGAGDWNEWAQAQAAKGRAHV